MDTETQIQELTKKVEKLERILGGLSNDTRLQSTIRNAVIVGEHTTDKPIIIDANGKRYNLQTT